CHMWDLAACPTRRASDLEEFAELRRAAPIWWNPQPPEVGGFHDAGFWVVSKHADVKEVSRRSDVFSTYENTAIPRFNDDITRERSEEHTSELQSRENLVC